MFDVFGFFGQDRILIVVEPVVETADVFLWDLWTCPKLSMLEDKFIYGVTVNLLLAGSILKSHGSSA